MVIGMMILPVAYDLATDRAAAPKARAAATNRPGRAELHVDWEPPNPCREEGSQLAMRGTTVCGESETNEVK